MSRYYLTAIISILIVVSVPAWQTNPKLVLDEISKSSVRVSVFPEPGTSGLYDFKAEIAGQEANLHCEMKATSTQPMCTIQNLATDTTYQLKVFACIRGTCTFATSGWFRTAAGPKTAVVLDEIAETSIRLTVFPLAIIAGLYDYKAQIAGHEADFNCEIKAELNQRSCSIKELVAGTVYTVRVLSCVKGGANCQEIFTGVFTTATQNKPVIVLDQITETSARVTVIPESDTETIFNYKAQITGEEASIFCEIKVESPQWSCDLRKLVAGRQYNTRVLRCTKDPVDCQSIFDAPFTTPKNMPLFVALEPITATTVTVEFIPKPASTIIGLYLASVRSGFPAQPCQITGDSAELKCSISELLPYTQYTLYVRRCDIKACQDVLEEKFTTADASLQTKVLLDDISETSVSVTVVPPPEALGLYHFKAQIIGRESNLECEIKVDSSSLKCNIATLITDTTYNIAVLSCRLGVKDCRTFFDGWFTTGKALPVKKLIVLESLTSKSVIVRLVPSPATTLITPYAARIKDGSPTQTCSIPAGSAILQCQIDGLQASTQYTVEALPCDASLQSCDPVAEEKFTTADALPNTQVVLDGITETSVKITVQQPADAGNLYDYTAQITGHEENRKCDIESSSPTSACEIQNLVTDTTYNVQVLCCRNAGPSCEIIFDGWFTTAAALSGKKMIVLESITSKSVTVQLVPLPGTDIIPPYAARIKGGSPTQACSIPAGSTALNCQINGLQGSKEYTVEVLPCNTSVQACDPVADETFTTADATLKTEIILDEITATGVRVMVLPPPPTIGFYDYKAQITGQEGDFNCKLNPFTCYLKNLANGVTYNVQVLSFPKGTTEYESFDDGWFTTRTKRSSLLLLESITSHTVGVRVIPTPGSSIIPPFTARIKGGSPWQTCSIPASSEALRCQINGLAAFTQYTVEVCRFDTSACAALAEETFMTTRNTLVVLESITSNTVSAQVIPPSGLTLKPPYVVRIKGGSLTQSCSIPTGSADLRCQIDELQASTQYVVEALRCDASPCVPVAEEMFTTQPPSTSGMSQGAIFSIALDFSVIFIALNS